MMAEGGSAAAQPMGLCGGANQQLGQTGCEYCDCEDGHYNFCPTQMGLLEDDPADEEPCPTCKDGVCQCGPDEEDWLDADNWHSVNVNEGYYALFSVLNDALNQAQSGKGEERHGNGLSFLEQPALTITRAVGLGFPLGQAMKKIQECQRMDTDAAKRELLGAINYLAAAVLFLDEGAEK